MRRLPTPQEISRLVRPSNLSFNPGIFLIFCLCLAAIPFNCVASPEKLENYHDYMDMPFEYGEVIYHTNTKSPKQLYIIGISHRDPDSGANNSTTVQTQMELFHIGEWLKKTRNLNLLLPEGYFNDCRSSNIPSGVQAIKALDSYSLDNRFLEEKLEADAPFMNAEMLLMEYRSFHACQVEDRNVYNAVRSSLGRLKKSEGQPFESASNIAELRYLQEKRTAQLLQNIPAVIEDEVHRGFTGNQSALFTIGLSHIEDIIRYIENKSIYISSPADSTGLPDVLERKLNLLNSGYEITIIIPRTLMDDHKLLQLTNINRILLAAGKYPRQAQVMKD